MAAKLIKIEPDAPLCLMARKKVANEATKTLCGRKATKDSKGFIAKNSADAVGKLTCTDCKQEIRNQAEKKTQVRQEWDTIELETTGSNYSRYNKEDRGNGPKHFVRIFTEPVEDGIKYSQNTLVDDGKQAICAVQEYHQHPESGICKNFLPIQNNTHNQDFHAWTMSSRDPLSLNPSVNCFDRENCGLHGYISEGQWQELSPKKWNERHAKYLDQSAVMKATGK